METNNSYQPSYKNVYKKLFEAKKIIAGSSTKKGGYNSFSKYDYYTPSQIETLVMEVCDKVGIDFHFSLSKDEYGLVGKADIVNLEAPEEKIKFELRIDIPEIKATNRTQQYGGAMTYCRRYLQMNIFSIVDNKLDFDSQNNNEYISEDERAALYELVRSKEITSMAVKTILKTMGIESSTDIKKSQYDEVINAIKNQI